MSDFLQDNEVIQINRSTAPEDVIETTQNLRLALVQQMIKEGLPSDRREIRMLAEILRDTDTNALTAKKLNNEEKAINQASIVAKNIADIATAVGQGKNPFAAPAAVREIPVEASERLPVIDMVPGHTTQGVEKLNYDDFVKS